MILIKVHIHISFTNNELTKKSEKSRSNTTTLVSGKSNHCHYLYMQEICFLCNHSQWDFRCMPQCYIWCIDKPVIYIEWHPAITGKKFSYSVRAVDLETSNKGFLLCGLCVPIITEFWKMESCTLKLMNNWPSEGRHHSSLILAIRLPLFSYYVYNFFLFSYNLYLVHSCSIYQEKNIEHWKSHHWLAKEPHTASEP